MPLFSGRGRARAARNEDFGRRLAERPVSLYQAARITGGSPTEVAVWLLMERGYVHIARDGRARTTSARFDRIADDPAQEAEVAVAAAAEAAGSDPRQVPRWRAK